MLKQYAKEETKDKNTTQQIPESVSVTDSSEILAKLNGEMSDEVDYEAMDDGSEVGDFEEVCGC